jgi:hypothetical protein
MNYLPIEFGVVSGVGCGDGVALNGSAFFHIPQMNEIPAYVPRALANLGSLGTP